MLPFTTHCHELSAACRVFFSAAVKTQIVFSLQFPGTARMATPAGQLESFPVATHRVDREIFDLLRAAGVESVSDYIGLYAEAEYEDGLLKSGQTSPRISGATRSN